MLIGSWLVAPPTSPVSDTAPQADLTPNAEETGTAPIAPEAPPLSTTQDGIIFEFHPSSNQPRRHFPTYLDSTRSPSSSSPDSPQFVPWTPFVTRADFEFAEFSHQERLSDASVDRLLKNLHSSWAPVSNITLKDAKEMRELIAQAKERVSTVSGTKYYGNRKLTASMFCSVQEGNIQP